MTFDVVYEAAFGADRDDDPASWTWTDLTTRTRDQRTSIRTGRSASDAGQARPGAHTITLDNGDAELTPRNPASSLYPNVVRGTPVRVAVDTGVPYLPLDGTSSGHAETADAAALDITGDLSGAIEYEAPLRLSTVFGTFFHLAGKYNIGGNQRSWLLNLDDYGLLNLGWSTDGSNSGLTTVVSTIGPPSPDHGPVTIGWYLDVDDGASGHQVTFYALRGTIAELVADPDSFILGAPITGSGTTSIFSSTADLFIGDVESGTLSPHLGGIRKFILHSGTLDAGTAVANPDFTAETVGDTSLTDAAGRSWTFPALTNRRSRYIGELSASDLTFPGHGVTGTEQATWSSQGVFRRLQDGAALESALYRFLSWPFSGADGYWPGEDGADTQVITSAIAGGLPGRWRGLTFGADSTLPASKAIPTASAGTTYAWNFTNPAGVEGSWSAACVFKIPTLDTSPAYQILMGVRTTGSLQLWNLRVNDTQMQVVAFDDDGSAVVNDTNTSLPDGLAGSWCVAQLTADEVGGSVDWVASITTIGGDSVTLSATESSQSSGRALRIGTPNQTAPADGGISIGHWAVGSFVDDGWYFPAANGYDGEPAPERARRLCFEEGVPIVVNGTYGHDPDASDQWAAVYAADPGLRPMGPQRPLQLTALLQECADLDGGVLAESREVLGVYLRSGRTMTNQTAALTLTSEVVQPVTATDDDRDLVNDATITRPEGASATITDEASITLEQRHADTRTINVKSDLHLPDHASWWVHQGAWPEVRTESVTVELAKTAAKVTDWIATDLGDTLAATSLPAAMWPTSLTQIIDGYTETLSPFLWTVTANGRPAGPFDVGVRGDDDLGKRDTAGSELDASATTTDTSIDVLTTLGPLWTTDSGELPFDINIGGEQITVTAIGAATANVQTFTVTRSVNSIVKAHSAGAAVALWRPTIRAL